MRRPQQERVRAIAALAISAAIAVACGVEAKPSAQLVNKAPRTDTGGGIAAADTAPSYQIDSTPPDQYAEFTGSGAYIDSVFKRQIGEAPRLGWFLGDAFLAGEKHPRIYIMSSVPSLIEGTLRRIGSDAERRRIRDTARVACDGDGGLAFFDVPGSPPADERHAFFLSKTIAPMQAGVQRRTPTEEESRAARAPLNLPSVEITFLESTFEVSGSAARYVVSAAFDSRSGRLLSTSLVLMSAGGRLAGSDVKEERDFECDGCEPPTLDDGLRRVYPVLNGYTINGFVYPLLLLNTSTNEGQARSLVTFNRGGKYGEYRGYEYIVNCGR